MTTHVHSPSRPTRGLVPSRYVQFFDIAGAVTERIAGKEYLTVAGVALLPDQVEIARRAIPDGFPKWSRSTFSEARRALDLIDGLTLTALTVRIRREPRAWSAFWSDAKRYRDARAQKIQGSGFLKAANLIKFFLFGECSARLFGETLRRLGRPTLSDQGGRQVGEISVVCDSDIQGEDNIAAFKELWEIAEGSQLLFAREQLAWCHRSVELETEQQEPLLLLPDYLAGIVHTCSPPRSVTPPPAVSPHELDALQEALERLPHLARVETTFDLVHANIFGKD